MASLSRIAASSCLHDPHVNQKACLRWIDAAFQSCSMHKFARPLAIGVFRSCPWSFVYISVLIRCRLGTPFRGQKFLAPSMPPTRTLPSPFLTHVAGSPILLFSHGNIHIGAVGTPFRRQKFLATSLHHPCTILAPSLTHVAGSPILFLAWKYK